jgi:glycosyltransferase involved in cell wall biosynthesis
MKKTICLNMIVKNENKIIKRCLDSVKNWIDYWVIVDTGSTDGTQETIREYMQNIPGELHEYPWVDFAHNRNQALAIAKNKADYLLFIDADEQLIFSPDFKMTDLDKDCYFFLIHQLDEINYFRESLIRSSLHWKWNGPVHEMLSCPEETTYEMLRGVTNLSITEDGHRFQNPNKYLEDAAVLEKALLTEPENSRYIFYTALSYGNARHYEEALKWHKKRTAIEDSEQEVFYSLLSIGKIQENLPTDPEEFIRSYTTAYLYRPSRAEPLYFLANYYIRTGNHLLGYLTSKMGLTILPTTDIIFVQHAVYDTGLLLQFADCAYALKKYDETFEAYQKLLQNQKLSEEMHKLIYKNLEILKSAKKNQIL